MQSPARSRQLPALPRLDSRAMAGKRHLHSSTFQRVLLLLRTEISTSSTPTTPTFAGSQPLLGSFRRLPETERSAFPVMVVWRPPRGVPASDIAFDPQGRWLIADSGARRVRRVDLATGIITTVAGSGNIPFAGDGGLATAAGMSALGVAVDSKWRHFHCRHEQQPRPSRTMPRPSSSRRTRAMGRTGCSATALRRRTHSSSFRRAWRLTSRAICSLPVRIRRTPASRRSEWCPSNRDSSRLWQVWATKASLAMADRRSPLSCTSRARLPSTHPEIFLLPTPKTTESEVSQGSARRRPWSPTQPTTAPRCDRAQALTSTCCTTTR